MDNPQTPVRTTPTSETYGWFPKTAADQRKLLPTHPMDLKAYALPTPPIERALALSIDRVKAGLACCGFVGSPRFGKSFAADFVAAELRETFSDARIIKLGCRLDMSRSPAALCDWFSTQSDGPSLRTRGKIDPMVSLSRRWIAETFSMGARKIVLVVDEIGRLNQDQLTTLADITNVINREGVRVTSIVFGSMETVALKNSLLHTGRTDLIGRFLSRLHQFDGIRSSQELGTLMAAFDDPEVADFPRGSGCAFSQFYLPTYYAHGWRLESCASVLWDEFKAMEPRKGLEIGAEYVFTAIEYFLKRSMTCARETLNLAVWKVAVFESGFADAVILDGKNERL